MKILRRLKKIFYGTYARGFVSSYFLVAFLGAVVLRLPISLQEGVELSLIDAVFVSFSALSVTGLTPVVVRDVFTVFGQMTLLFIIQFGGIGLIMLLAIFWLAVRKRIGFRHRNMIMADQNQFSRAGIVRFVRNVLYMIFIIEAIGFLLIAPYLYYTGYFPIGEALYQALFMTVSLFTNAGFDIAPAADSFQMFSGDFYMQSIGITMMFLGSLGFLPLAEFKEYLQAKWHREKFNFSNFVKLLFVLHLSFWLFGALLIFILESQSFFIDKPALDTIYYSLFMSITTRNAGWSTMDVSLFDDSTLMMIITFMFIGANPNSVGGGIRTTTFIIAFLSIRAFATGRPHIILFNRAVMTETIHKSFVALASALMIVMTAVIVMTALEPHDFLSLFFEVVSAFGTTGLSMGVTALLRTSSKILLILMMFIGRIGILALLLMFKPEVKKRGHVEYPEANIIVG